MAQPHVLGASGEPGPTDGSAGRLFRDHPSVMLFIDPSNGRIADANDAAARFYGWSRDELRSMRVGELNTADPATIRAEMARAVTGSRSVFAFRHRLAGGHTRDVEVHSGPIELEGRTLLHSVVVDVTERNDALAALQESEALASAIVANAPHGIAVTDLDGRMIRVNAALCDIVGRSETDLLGSHYFVMTHPDDRPATARARARLHRGELSVYEMRKRYVRGDGSVAHVQVASSLLRDGEGRPRFQLGLVEDVSARVLMEEALDRKMAQEAALSQFSRRAVGEREMDTLAQDAVSTVARMLDASAAVLWRASAGAGERTAIAYEGAAGAAATLTPIAAAEVPGRVRPWGVLEVLGDAGDELPDDELPDDQLRFLQSVVDVLGSAIGRRDVEDQLQQSQKLEAIGRLAGSVAHDMNNVLTTILGQAELLSQAVVDDDPLAPGLTQIHEAGQRGAAVTRRILAYSRSHSGRSEPVDVAELVTGLRPMLDALVGDSVEVVISASPGWVLINDRELEQAVLNLAVNACDAMPEGGRLTVEAGPLGPEPGGTIRLRVADTGLGMDPDTIERAPEAFFTTKDADHGTGLGLSMVEELVTSANGNLTIDSSPGAGTTVCLDLPRAKPAAGGSAVAAPAPTSGSSARILVVEDEPTVRDLVVRVLERAGYEVKSCPDGDSAWGLVNDGLARIDLLVTDSNMPGMTGPELASRLRERWDGLPVVLMSGHPDVASAATAYPERSLLAKPFTGEELLKVVAATWER